MWRLGRFLAVTVVIAGIVFSGGPAMAAPGQPSVDDVYAQLGKEVNRATADVIVMVDVSKSMDAARYDRVREALTGYFESLAPVDQVTLIAYADSATVTATQRVGKAPAQLVDSLPATTGGGRSGLTEAVDAAITTLHRPKAPGLGTVLLLSAGPDDGAPRKAEWNELKDRAREVWQRVDAYAIPLATVTGASRLAKVWPATILPTTTVGELPWALGQARDAARQIKTRNLLAGDITKPLRVNWPEYGGIPHGTSVTRVEVKSPLKYVPVTIDQVAITGDNPAVTLSVPPGPYELLPGKTIELPVTAHWDAGPRRAWPFFTVNGRTEVELSARATSSWAPMLADDLDLTFETTFPVQPVDRDLSAQRGSFWYWLSAIVLVAALTELLVWWWRHPPEKRRKNRTVTVAGTSFTWQEEEMERATVEAGSV